MTIRGYIAFMVAGSSIAALAWYVVLSTVDPFTAPFFGIALFYLAFSLALLGAFTLLIFVARSMIDREELPVRTLGIAVREAFWAVAFLVIVLVLLRRNMLAWWNVIPLVLGFSLAEYACLALRRRPAVRHSNPSHPSHPPRPPIRTIQ